MLVTDLSDWNDHINWSHLIAAGVGGAIVKISEGRSLTQLHGKHIAGAEARGLPWGAYCYTHAQTTERAREEANRVIEALNALGYGTPPLGIWFDAEAPEVIGQGGIGGSSFVYPLSLSKVLTVAFSLNSGVWDYNWYTQDSKVNISNTVVSNPKGFPYNWLVFGIV